MACQLSINGQVHEFDLAHSDTPLVFVLRETLGLTRASLPIVLSGPHMVALLLGGRQHVRPAHATGAPLARVVNGLLVAMAHLKSTASNDKRLSK
ncbi:MAG: hypothetical protein GVY32_03125 [Gammaproteobacteria bacterium]|jgi:hypothetical protein|nr:hypothetical protein [Gammaproteobacteria bacterium]